MGALKPALFYDNMTCDEMGILLASEKRGINLETADFSTFVKILGEKNSYSPVINRCQSKSRRERASFLIEEQGGRVINPFSVEVLCNNKVFTINRFEKLGVKTVKTAYVPFAVEKEGDKPVYRADALNRVIREVEGLFKYPFVIKPERGSRGRNVMLIDSKSHFETILKKWVRSLDSPAGFLIQEPVSKAFDLRIVTSSYDGEKHNYLASLARVPSSKEAFATNTALGAIPVGVELPQKARDEAVKASKAVSQSINILGVDAIPEVSEDIAEEIISLAEKISVIHNDIKRLKEEFSSSVKLSMEKFIKARERMDAAFQKMINASEYVKLKEMLENVLGSTDLYFIEANSRPDFYINTRNCTGVDISEEYAKCIEASL
jgi:glutathione synthase/RimK-type ligase-like ATP-grasp enzyme